MGRAIRALVEYLVENNKEPQGVSNAVFKELIETQDYKIKEIVERIGVLELGDGCKLVSCPGMRGGVCLVNGNSCEGVVIEEVYDSGGIFDRGRWSIDPGEFKPVVSCPYIDR